MDFQTTVKAFYALHENGKLYEPGKGVVLPDKGKMKMSCPVGGRETGLRAIVRPDRFDTFVVVSSDGRNYKVHGADKLSVYDAPDPKAKKIEPAVEPVTEKKDEPAPAPKAAEKAKRKN